MKRNYLREFIAWLRLQPFTRPLLALLYSRKAIIAAALTALILTQFPGLGNVEPEVGVVTQEIVLIVVIWLVTSLGYVLEDVAEKAQKLPKV